VRQFVATDTLMSGTTGVAVKIGVGDRVAVGVALGVNVGPGVDVSTTATGKPAKAVPVAPEIIVSITEVPRAFRSCVGAGTPDIVQARERSNKAVTDRQSRPVDKRIGVDFFIFVSFRYKASISPKTRIHPLTCGTLTPRDLFPTYQFENFTRRQLVPAPELLYDCATHD
jgi:hypothetical protein